LGDAEGVIVIPAEIADEIAAEAAEMTVFEDFVLERTGGCGRPGRAGRRSRASRESPRR
jgi:regulator of RNase E activity RraA